MQDLPLSGYELFRSVDLDETREIVAWMFCEHRMNLIGPAKSLDARMHAYRLGHVSVNFLKYGADVDIKTNRLDSFYVVQIPISGSGLVHYHGETFHSTSKLATVVSPTGEIRQQWTADCAQLIVRIERAALQVRLRDMLGVSLAEPLVFQPQMDLADGGGATWARGVWNFVEGLDRAGVAFRHEGLMRQFDELLMTSLLVTQPHNFTRLFAEEQQTQVPSRPAYMARDLIEAHPEWRHTARSLARHANVSERTLYAAFHEYLDRSPKAYLTDVRMRRAYNELRSADPRMTTVGQVAGRLGFAHRGRFARAYRERFGELPSDTLRM